MKTLGLFLILFAMLSLLAAPAFFKEPRRAPGVSTLSVASERYARFDQAMRFDAQKNSQQLKLVQQHAPSSARLLDVGCRVGDFLSQLPQETTGLDHRLGMVTLASRWHPSIVFQHGSAEHRHVFQSECFDTITCFGNYIFLFYNKEQVLQNMLAWLQPGGVLLLTVSYPFNPVNHPSGGLAYNTRLVHNTMQERVIYENTSYKMSYPVYYESAKTIEGMAHTAGFRFLTYASVANEQVAVFRKTTL